MGVAFDIQLKISSHFTVHFHGCGSCLYHPVHVDDEAAKAKQKGKKFNKHSQ